MDDDTAKVSAKAFKWLAKHRLPPSPQCFAVAYELCRGKNAELTKAVKKATKVRPHECRKWFELHLHSPEQRKLASARDQLKQLISALYANFNSADNEFERLSTLLEHLKSPNGSVAATDLVDQLHEETEAVCRLSESLREEVKASHSAIQQLKKDIESTQYQVRHDPLTNALRRSAFDATLKSEADEAAGHPLCLMMIDIDHFKRVNDAHGHRVGDKVLQAVARILMHYLKGKDTVGRFGGEEFAAILPDTPYEGALKLADNVRKSIEKALFVNPQTKEALGAITISVGVAQYKPDEELSAFLDRADQCLYYAKRHGRNRVTGQHRLTV